jgi:Mg2+ and Co2+ transporter CorA
MADHYTSFVENIEDAPLSPGKADASADAELYDTSQEQWFEKGEVSWTNADHARLLSIDELHTRLLEYHNNVHARTIYGVDGFNISSQSKTEFVTSTAVNNGTMSPTKSNSDQRARAFGTDVVVQVKHFSSNTKKDAPTYLHYKAMNPWLDKYSTTSENVVKNELTWIHIKDPAVLPSLGDRFNIHDLCLSGFSDLRAYSSYVPVPGAVFVSFCTFSLGMKKANMFKVFIYVTKNVVITFEREVMPDLLEVDGPVQDNVCSTVMSSFEKIQKNCCNLGGIYLMYSLALQSLSMQDSIIDFFSRALYYFKQKVSTRQYHKEKLKIARQMHCVSVSVTMIKNSIIHAEETFVRILSGAMTGTFTVDTPEHEDEEGEKEGSEGFQIVQLNGITGKVTTAPRVPLLAPLGLVTADHTPYLLDIVDSYKFANHILMTELEEVQALHLAMDALTTLRSINTSTLLSFVATIFLPLNFVCGVFGTNFVDDEGLYYMKILNDPQGPTYFLIMCVASVVLIFIYFWYNGWIDFRTSWGKLFHSLTCRIFSSRPSTMGVKSMKA